MSKYIRAAPDAVIREMTDDPFPAMKLFETTKANSRINKAPNWVFNTVNAMRMTPKFGIGVKRSATLVAGKGRK